MSEATEPLRLALVSLHTSPLAPPGGPDVGGMNVYVRQLARELGRRGHRVDVFTRRDRPDQPETLELAPGVRLVHLAAGPATPLEKEEVPPLVPLFAEALRRFAEGEAIRYDLVHSHYWLSGLAGEAVSVAWGVPHLVTFHTLGEVKNRARLTEREPEERIAAERRLVGSCDVLVCASDHEVRLLTRLYGADPARTRVVPLGVDLEIFRPLDKEEARRSLGLSDEPIMLYVGRVAPLKGLDILIHAAAQVEGNFCVLVVGGGEGVDNHVRGLRRLAATVGIAERVAFLGPVEHDRLPWYYSAADVCVVPSFYESFGLAAVEAMACGTPVVASRVGGLVSTVRDGETGYLISWRCPEPFAERLELLLANPDLRASLGRAARASVQRFHWSHVGDAIISVYEEVRQAARGVAAAVSTAPASP